MYLYYPRARGKDATTPEGSGVFIFHDSYHCRSHAVFDASYHTSHPISYEAEVKPDVTVVPY